MGLSVPVDEVKAVSTYSLMKSFKSPRNREILGLYCIGFTPRQIVEKFGESGRKISEKIVWSVIYSPDAREYLKVIEAENEERLQNMFSTANQVIHDGMNCPDLKIALAAAALYFKVSGRMVQNVNVKHSAEDVVAQLLMEAERRRMEREGALIE